MAERDDGRGEDDDKRDKDRDKARETPSRETESRDAGGNDRASSERESVSVPANDAVTPSELGSARMPELGAWNSAGSTSALPNAGDGTQYPTSASNSSTGGTVSPRGMGASGSEETIPKGNPSKLSMDGTYPDATSASAVGFHPGDKAYPNGSVANPAGSSPLPNAGDGKSFTGAERIVYENGRVAGVKSENGYYDPTFQSLENIVNNFHHGDKMKQRDLELLATAGFAPAKQELAGYNLQGGEKLRTTDWQNEWNKNHNDEITKREGMTTGNGVGGNRAATSVLEGQRADVTSSPNSLSGVTERFRNEMDGLPNVSNVTTNRDLSVTYTENGQSHTIPLGNLEAALDVLRSNKEKAGIPTTPEPTVSRAATAAVGGRSGGGSGVVSPSGASGPSGRAVAGVAGVPDAVYGAFQNTVNPAGRAYSDQSLAATAGPGGVPGTNSTYPPNAAALQLPGNSGYTPNDGVPGPGAPTVEGVRYGGVAAGQAARDALLPNAGGGSPVGYGGWYVPGAPTGEPLRSEYAGPAAYTPAPMPPDRQQGLRTGAIMPQTQADFNFLYPNAQG